MRPAAVASVPLFVLSFVALLLLLTGLGSPAHAAFVSLSSGPIGDTSNSMGVAWGDYDNDGDLDLYVSNANTGNKLLRNQGGGIWQNVTPAVLATTGITLGSAWGDYDNDGDLDLYVGKSGTACKLFRNNGGGSFTDVTPTVLASTSSTETVSWVDVENDGDLDLFAVKYGAADKLYRNDGGSWADATPLALADPDDGHGSSWGDYDGDHDMDLFVGTTPGCRIYRNDGGWAFVDRTPAHPELNLTGGTGVIWGDYNSDCDMDIYIGREVVINRLFRNDENEVFSNIEGPFQLEVTTQGVGFADYDNDGDMDLMVGTAEEGAKLFRNDGASVFSSVTEPSMSGAGSVRGLAWADYDMDGDMDAYLAIWGGANKLLRNDLNSNNKWLHIDLTGTISNRFAIGARVRIVAAGQDQIREVTAGGGLYSQESPTLEFGLGNVATQADTIEVFWPSGVYDIFVGQAVNMRLPIIEGSTVGVGNGFTQQGYRLLPAVPNPFGSGVHGSTRIEYVLPESAPVDLRVFDIRGSLVRVLESDLAKPAGRHEATWDGLDRNGVPLRSGIYFFRLVADRYHRIQKVALLR